MAEFLTVDGTPVPVDVNSWEETFNVPGSRARTETGHIRSVRTGEETSVFVGTSYFDTRAEANAIRDIMKVYGDHDIDGEGPGRAAVVEIDVSKAKAVDHRPANVDPTAQWRLSWTLTETGPSSGGS